VPPPEVIQHIRQLAADGCRIQRQYAIDDVIGPCPVGGIEVAWLGCRLERPHDDPRRVRAQVQRLSIEERILYQSASAAAAAGG
jgi:hypothetical protein